MAKAATEQKFAATGGHETEYQVIHQQRMAVILQFVVCLRPRHRALVFLAAAQSQSHTFKPAPDDCYGAHRLADDLVCLPDCAHH